MAAIRRLVFGFAAVERRGIIVTVVEVIGNETGRKSRLMASKAVLVTPHVKHHVRL